MGQPRLWRGFPSIHSLVVEGLGVDGPFVL